MFTEVILTVAESKRLIAKGIVGHPDVMEALKQGTVVLCKGTTNAYVAEELLGKELKKTDYVTGATMPAARKGPSPVANKLPDIVLDHGEIAEGVTTKDVVAKLKPGDVFIKGANAINYDRGQAALLIGHPLGGTIGAAIGAIVARRVKLLMPVGLEKNIPGDLNDVAAHVADALEEKGDRPLLPVGPEGASHKRGLSPFSSLPALWVVPGEIFTEIEAIRLLTGCDAVQTGAGGIAGAEGAVRLLLEGEPDQVRQAKKIVDLVRGEPPFVTE